MALVALRDIGVSDNFKHCSTGRLWLQESQLSLVWALHRLYRL